MKRIASLITVIALTVSAVGCSVPQKSEGKASSEVSDETVSSSADNSSSSDGDAGPGDAEGSELKTKDKDFEAADRGRLIPCVTGFVDSKFYKENNFAYLSFITLDGEIIFKDPFDSVSYCDEEGVYIVRRTVDGVSKYGFLSDNGAIFTGLIYDGSAEAVGNRKEGVCFYGTNYADGKLLVSSLDKRFNVIATDTVTIDENEISMVAENAQLSVLYIDETRTVMINRAKYYYRTMLIDNASGKLLYPSTPHFQDTVTIFGSVIIEQWGLRDDATVYDMSGKELLADRKAYTGMVSDDRFMVARNNKLVLYDTNWQTVASLDYPDGAFVKTSFGRIAVADGSETRVYDKELNLIKTLDYSADNGSYLKDRRDYGEGDMYYQTRSEDEEFLINLNTGARILEEDNFYYEFDEGYIIADNSGEWRIYDKDLNLLQKGDGRIEVIKDDVTGDVYMIIENNKILTVYSLPDFRDLFSFSGNIAKLEATDGRFHCWDFDYFILLNSTGKEIKRLDVEYSESWNRESPF